MSQPAVLIPLPNRDFDPTEAAVPWKALHQRGYTVVFATPDGKRGYADPLMVTGEGLDPWGFIPGLKKISLIGLFLRADRYGRQAYEEMARNAAYLAPLRYDQLKVEDYDALLLPGGHAKGVRAYLESETLQRFVADFMANRDGSGSHPPLGAICHGPVLLSRSQFANGRPVLEGRRVTALTWEMERNGWWLTRFFARFWEPHYYRTYVEKPGEPTGYRSVEQEVKRALGEEGAFIDVPDDQPDRFHKVSNLFRDRPDDERPAWVVEDGNLVTARWPGDSHTFAKRFIEVIERWHRRDQSV